MSGAYKLLLITLVVNIQFYCRVTYLIECYTYYNNKKNIISNDTKFYIILCIRNLGFNEYTA